MSRIRQKVSSISVDQRIEYAELLRERIYSTITLLAVVVTLWQHANNYSAWAVVGAVIGTVGALWLATLIASRMSYRIVHDGKELEMHYRKASEAASGLLAPAVMPVALTLISMTGLFTLEAALASSVILLVLSLFMFSLVSGRKIASSFLSLVVYSLLQLGLGLVVVALKLIVK